MKIGIIGYQNHAAKIIKLISYYKKVNQIVIYCYKKKLIKELNSNSKKNIIYTNNLDDLIYINAVFISSPNDTHFQYIKFFLKYKVYIFCEKPPCINLKQIHYLRSLSTYNKSRIYFHYNFFNSKFKKILIKEFKKRNVGKPIHISINISHGIAYSQKFTKWRKKQKNIFDNIVANLGIHYLELLIFLYGDLKNIKFNYSSVAKKNIYDTGIINCCFSNNITCCIFLSYASSYNKSIEFQYTNAKIHYKNDDLLFYYPRDTFDKQGKYCEPKVKKLKIFKDDMHLELMKDSIDFFFNSIKNKKFFLNLFDYSINLCNIFLKENNNFKKL